MKFTLQIFVWTVFSFLIWTTPVYPATLYYQSLDEHKFPLALCNDGSRAGYYYASPVSSSPKSSENVLWIIHQQGGDWCFDGESCALRYQQAPQLTGSGTWPTSRWIGGIFGEPPFSSSVTKDSAEDSTSTMNTNPSILTLAHLVYIPYCTSDAHAGNVSMGVEFFPSPTFKSQPRLPKTWHFRGREVVRAIFADLKDRHGMGDDNSQILPHVPLKWHSLLFPGRRSRSPPMLPSVNTTILYSGCSAGARGVMLNLNYIQNTLLASLFPANGSPPRLLGLLDSAFWIDRPPLPESPSFPSFQEQARRMYSILEPSLHPECVADQSADLTWRCLIGEYAIKYIRVPYLMNNFQFDSFQLQRDAGIKVDEIMTPRQTGFADNFRNWIVHASLNTINISSLTRGEENLMKSLWPKIESAAIMPACFLHCNTEGSGFSTLYNYPGGQTLEQALISWLSGQGLDGQGSRFSVEECEGFDCGKCLRGSEDEGRDDWFKIDTDDSVLVTVD